MSKIPAIVVAVTLLGACSSSPVLHGDTTPTTAVPGTSASAEAPRSTSVSAEPPVVVAVVDGDTIRVRFPDGGEEPVRLIGIDTPEAGEPNAGAAAARLAEMLAAGEMSLEADVSDRDPFGRLLRYVFVDGVFVNATMVREGLATAVDYPPDTGRSDELHAAEGAARDSLLGIWAPPADTTLPTASTRVAPDGATDQPGVADVVIARVRFDADGNDNENKNDEWVEIENRGDGVADLSGWRLEDEGPNHTFRFPAGFSLAPGASVRVFSGCGTASATALYFCNTGSAVWNNSGDTASLIDSNGALVDQRS